MVVLMDGYDVGKVTKTVTDPGVDPGSAVRTFWEIFAKEFPSMMAN